MKFNIGNRVRWNANPENEYEIIATRETPSDRTGASYANQPIRVATGFDYLLLELAEDGGFHPWENAMERDLELIED